ncbi:MAG: hypothetical protein HQM08_12765 [Candidatus Riflebacteria bacterium]|nr:hypothetical protein [Candidatus Riflebacteria bacterium]
MAQFQAINPKVEVNGQTVLAIANSMGVMKTLGLKILKENGIADPIPEKWYSQQSWLNAFKQISETVGINTLNLIGKSIPENAKFPPQIDDIHKGLASIEVAFHMNHRLNGCVLFNPADGQMIDVIGHYRYKKISETMAEISCDNPYPCDFDKGIIEAMAKKFKPSDTVIEIEHSESKGCRKKNGDICVYIVSWTSLR